MELKRFSIKISWKGKWHKAYDEDGFCYDADEIDARIQKIKDKHHINSILSAPENVHKAQAFEEALKILEGEDE